MESTFVNKEDKIIAENIMTCAKTMCGSLIRSAQAHRSLEEKGLHSAPLWWPPVLLRYHREKFPTLHTPEIVHLIAPCVLSHVRGTHLVDLLHSVTSLVLKDSANLDARLFAASHLFPLHELLSSVPDAFDAGIVRRTGKWIESAFTLWKAPTVSPVIAPKSGKGRKSGGSGGAEGSSPPPAGRKSGELPSTQPEHVVPIDLINAVYRQHRAICALYGMEGSLRKDIAPEHLQSLETRSLTEESKAQARGTTVLPRPYSFIPFPVYGRAGNDGAESVVGDESTQAPSEEPVRQSSKNELAPLPTPLLSARLRPKASPLLPPISLNPAVVPAGVNTAADDSEEDEVIASSSSGDSSSESSSSDGDDDDDSDHQPQAKAPAEPVVSHGSKKTVVEQDNDARDTDSDDEDSSASSSSSSAPEDSSDGDDVSDSSDESSD